MSNIFIREADWKAELHRNYSPVDFERTVVFCVFIFCIFIKESILKYIKGILKAN